MHRMCSCMRCHSAGLASLSYYSVIIVVVTASSYILVVVVIGSQVCRRGNAVVRIKAHRGYRWWWCGRLSLPVLSLQCAFVVDFVAWFGTSSLSSSGAHEYSGPEMKQEGTTLIVVVVWI